VPSVQFPGKIALRPMADSGGWRIQPVPHRIGLPSRSGGPALPFEFDLEKQVGIARELLKPVLAR
jgi:hypothetical protein